MSLTATSAADLTCPSCGAGVAAEQVNVQAMAAVCTSCNKLVELARTRVTPPDSLQLMARPPAGLTVLREAGEELVVRYRWFRMTVQLLFLSFFALAWDTFLVFWYAIGLGMLDSGAGPVSILMLVFPIAHVAVGVGITYAVLAQLVNRTTLTLSRGRLQVSHGPLPWRGPGRLALGSIDQFYVVRRMVRHQKGSANQVQAGAFQLVARHVDRTSDVVMDHLHDDKQARWLERRLEAHLRIPDQPVEGEYEG